MSDERLTVDELRDRLEDFDGADSVSVRFEGSPPMPVERLERRALGPGEDDPAELILVLPAQPTEDAAVDSDFSRLCEKVMRDESVIFQVRFGADLMRQCNADTPEKRMQALSMYFAEAKRRVDETIRFGEEAARVAEEEEP